MASCLLVLTNLAFPLAALGVVLGFLFSPRRKLLTHLRAELQERFGWTPKQHLPQQAVWLHCASVGEVNAIRGVIKQLKQIYGRDILITTSTQAGKETARKNPDVTAAFLAPLDFYPVCKHFIKNANPYRLFVVEREIWPNMLWAAHRAHVPYAIINGRISKKSARAYSWVKPLFEKVLSPVAFAALQSDNDAKRYQLIGVPGDKIYVCGNVKYDTLCQTPAHREQALDLLQRLGWQGHPLLVLGSTHPPEETMLLRAAPDILKTGTKILFAPRHLERKAEIEQSLVQSRLRFAFTSQETFDPHTDIVCADTMGMLQAWYACASLCFVGGSVAPCGAHNLLEAAILGKTVLFGKHFYNTPETARALLESGGGVLVNQTNFKETVLRLLADREQLDNMNQKARQTALHFKGATDKIRGIIEAYEHKTTA